MATSEQIGKYLVAVAVDEDTVYYSDLIKEFDLPPLEGNWSSHPLSSIFEILDKEDNNANRPFRTTVVVKKHKEFEIPGDGYFEALERLKNISIPRNNAGKEAVWIGELRKVYSYNWNQNS